MFFWCLTVFTSIFIVPTKCYVRWGPGNESRLDSDQSFTNETSFLLKPKIINMNLNEKKFYSRPKNRTFQSIRDIINPDFKEYSEPRDTIEPYEADLKDYPSSEFINDRNKPRDCVKVRNPTLTPQIRGRPRYVKIEWRKTVLPSSTPQSPKMELYYPPSPFYYQKLIDYRPGSPVGVTSIRPLKRPKKSGRRAMTRMISSLIRQKKKRPKPGYVYIPSLPHKKLVSQYYYGLEPSASLSRDTAWSMESLNQVAHLPVNNVTSKVNIEEVEIFQGDPRRYDCIRNCTSKLQEIDEI